MERTPLDIFHDVMEFDSLVVRLQRAEQTIAERDQRIRDQEADIAYWRERAENRLTR